MLIDEVRLQLKSGDGGNGCISFFPGRKSGPDGGDGGKGGNIVIVVDPSSTSFNSYAQKKIITAESGKPGQSFRREGRFGEDTMLKVPIGTTIYDENDLKIIELTKPGETFLICRGGRGGRGNEKFKSSTYQAPRKAEPGHPGEQKTVKLVMKLIADFGLIGLPNAGKSSLLNELTAASVKTAAYPFTTLEPNLGALPTGKILADIPGLIEGASAGKGLGTKFLKHIEKVKLLLHCVSVENENVLNVYETVRQELANHHESLIQKQEIILLTKIDTVNEQEIQEKTKQLQKIGNMVIAVSIHDFESIEQIKKLLAEPGA